MEAVATFCATSQLLSVGSPQQSQQLGGGEGRRRSVPMDGAACSHAAALLSEPKVRAGVQAAVSALSACRPSLSPALASC